MSINFTTYSDLWINAVNDKETEGLSQILSDDFVWVNDRFNWVANKQETIDWCKSTDLIGIDFTAYYENDEIMVGIHTAIEPKVADSSVMFIAKIIDSKVVSHHYIREYDR
jgi:hypothetical protein|tara:strand:- start:89 stop:421 length:333 start_codon:yes stop_codon:yes gene_type:complete